MAQQSVLTQTTQPEVSPTPNRQRWMRHFFSEDLSSDNSPVLDLQRRAAWVALALILQSFNEIDHGWYFPFIQPFGSLIPLALILGSFFAIWMAFRPSKPQQSEQAPARGPRRWQRVVLVMAVILSLGGFIQCGRAIVMSFLPPQFSNDGTALDTNAAMLLEQGRNPYTDSNMLDIYRRFDLAPDWTTPLRKGQFEDRLDYPSMAEFRSILGSALKAGGAAADAPEFESKVSYPALSFLTLMPFAWVNNYNVLPFYLLCYLLIIALAWRCARPEVRPWVILLAMANVPMWSSTVGGNLDIFYTLLIIMAWMLRESRWSSAVFLGLAIASKQIAWFFVPFYLLMVWRNTGFKEAVLRGFIAGAVGFAINLPFILWNPQAWLAGVLAPIADPMFPMGVGIVNLSVTHLIPYLPGSVYQGLEAVAMVVALVVYWFICRRRPEAALLLAVIPLFFAWRSLPSYFYCTAYPIFILMASHGTPSLRSVLATAGVRKFVASIRMPSPLKAPVSI